MDYEAREKVAQLRIQDARAPGHLRALPNVVSYGEAATLIERLSAENARLRAELSAAIGYMTNASIDLQSGATKATAIATVGGGIKRARAALAGEAGRG